MATNDLGLCTVQLGAFTFAGVIASITFDPIASVNATVTGGGVANKLKGRKATITLTVFPHEPGHATARALVTAWQASPVGVPLAGVAINGSSREVARWEGGAPVQPADMQLVEETEAATFSFEVWGSSVVQA